MTGKLSLKDLTLKGKKVLMRVDFNVPLDKNCQIVDDSRIIASLPSIRYVLLQGASLILMSHLGRPKDKKVPELSLAPCAKRLSELLHQPVIMAPDCVGPEVEKLAAKLSSGEVMLLENLRFHRGEEHPEENPEFVKNLAKLGDVYVNDAFGTAHRAHASTATITKYFPGMAAAGFLLENEIKFLGGALLHPKRPFIALVGGAKISTKIGVIKSLLTKADLVMIGGGMAYTFFKAQGIPIGNSLCEEEFVPEAKKILDLSKNSKAKFLLPEDHLVADRLEQNANSQILNVQQGVPEGCYGVDIGPKTVERFTWELKSGKTILWNGPLGIYEIAPFAQGTQAIARVLATLDAITIVGGGDSIAALQAIGVLEKMTHISTGGGASLEYIELGTLPGIEALSSR